MGSVPSTPRRGGAFSPETAEYLIGTFVGGESFPLSSEFWQKLLELPLNVQWPTDRVHQACELLAKNNCNTRHLAKILFHLACYLQESMSTSGVPPVVYEKAANAVYISSVFLKHLIESDIQLYLSFDDNEAALKDVLGDQTIEHLVMRKVLNFIASVEVSPNTFLLHLELLNFMIIAMSTQLLCGPSPGPNDVNPFLDAAMTQDSSLVGSVVRKLLLNFIARPSVPFNRTAYSIFYDGSQSSVLQRVGSAAANIVLLPFSYLISSSGEGSRGHIADSSLHVLLVLIHYHTCGVSEDYSAIENNKSSASESLVKENPYFSDNPYCKALEHAIDCELDRVDVEGNAHSGRHIKLPFASLFDTLGICLADEAAVLLLYSLLQGNSAFLEYVLVRTDMDTLLMPILEALYDAPRRTANQIYMLLIILLILSQDSSFNASIHKLILTGVPWYKERLLHQTSLGSLMVIILIRTVQYNLSKLRDVYLHTTCLATLANMAPHVHRLSAYASQRLVSLFDMLSRKYNKLADCRDNKIHNAKGNSIEGNSFVEDVSTELHIYTDFLRLVLEIMNAILTYALPRNPEVVYAVMHRQEVFQPYKNHPRFNELIENIYTVLDFFNSRMDAQRVDGDWSVNEVLQVIIVNCRSWRGDGMKMFTQLRFTYEQESHPEEFFIPYVWQLVLSRCGFTFNAGAINLVVLQHPPVFTLGTASSHQNLIFDINNPPFHVHRTERGGEVTYHGPGQLVVYPIINLRRHKMDLHWYLRTLEEVVIRVLSSTFSIQASRVEGLTGVWVGNEKLAAVGIRVAQWITYHGLALNVTTDLTPFKWIVPCGIRDRQVGSIKGLLRRAHGTADLQHLDDATLIQITHRSLIQEFSQAFQLEYHSRTISVPLCERKGSGHTKETRQS